MFARYATGTASTQTTLSILTGFNIYETAGSTAFVTFRGGGAGGPILTGIKLAAGESVGEQFGDNPASQSDTTNLIYVKVESGTVNWTAFGQ